MRLLQGLLFLSTYQPITSFVPKSVCSKMEISSAGLSDIGDTTPKKEGEAVNNPRNRHDKQIDKSLIPWHARIEGSIARSRKIRGGNFVQIATVDQEGFPRCRTVVFRGFINIGELGTVEDAEILPGESSDVFSLQSHSSIWAMKMITDARSEKVLQSTQCEMVWWFTQSSEQYRIAGRLELVRPEPEYDALPHVASPSLSERSRALQRIRKQQWGNLSDSAREQFYWTHPGRPMGREEFFSSDGTPATGGDDVVTSPSVASAPPPTGGRDSDGKVLPPPDTFLLLLLVPEQVKYLRLTDNYAQLDVCESPRESVDSTPRRWRSTRMTP